MKTLVIHPKDSSTEFLKHIYEGKGFAVISDPFVDRNLLKEEIEKFDRIIIMGHGTQYGLLNPYGFGYIVDDEFAELLRTKQTISIWCNSDLYYFRNGISDGNLHTGMIISEVSEQNYVLGKVYLNKEEQVENMELFGKTLGECIDYTPEEMVKHIRENYNKNDMVSKFNRSRLLLV